MHADLNLYLYIPVLILIFMWDRFSIPPPSTTYVEVNFGGNVYSFLQDDFHTSYAGFLTMLPPELQISRAATEMNRYALTHYSLYYVPSTSYSIERHIVNGYHYAAILLQVFLHTFGYCCGGTSLCAAMRIPSYGLRSHGCSR